MSYRHQGREIRKVGVIGSGQIGPDIALHFTKVLHRFGVPVTVVDISPEALARGKEKVHKKIEKGVASKAFAPAEAEAMRAGLTFTADYAALADADLVVEAATEDAALKGRIFSQLESLCPEGAILASNSSHLEPEAIFSGLRNRGRTAVLHYFFPAERNLVVEVVPGRDTRGDVADWLMGFYEAIGKVPVRVGSRYGYAVDPLFEGLFQAAALCVEEGLGSTKEVDAVACETLGLKVGPFTAMNLTGGNPITRHGLDEMHTKVAPWFKAPELLKRQMAGGKPWETPGRGEEVQVPPDRKQKIVASLRGAYIGLACEVLDSGITNVGDLEMAVESALDMTAPFRLMNELGLAASLALVEAYAKAHPGFPVGKCLKERAASGRPWAVPVVIRRDLGDIAVVQIRRPKVLNALDADAFGQIASRMREVREDRGIRAAVLTGFGVKAFVSGADVRFLARIASPQEGERTCLESQAVLNAVQDLGKPVVCAMNGVAFGGGMELAMACTARIARRGMGVLGAQPEPNLGIIPGAGGTQRLPRLVGIEKASEILRTGRPVSAEEAERIGLVQELCEGDLLDAAVAMARALADGSRKAPALPRGPLPDVPAELPPLELGHLSRRIDAILCETILAGARGALEEGLKLEARQFGACVLTEDMRIGIRNFVEKGPRSKAAFVHG